MRYDDRLIKLNTSGIYINQFVHRGVNFIKHFTTPLLKYPTRAEVSRENLEIVKYIWKENDKFYKLAYNFYGEAEYWWVIAWYNKAPTEFHITRGQTVFIPMPLDKILDLYDL